MVMQLFIGIILLAAASMLITQGKRRKVWSMLLLIALGGLSWLFIHNLSIGETSGFIYQWLPYRQLQADFNISASQRMQNLLLPMIYILAALIVLNITDIKENYSLNISVLNLLAFIGIILLASGRDFFQIMFADTILTILGFYIPDAIGTRRKFFIYGFLAEIACFIALAITYSSLNTISLSNLSMYTAKVSHKDFIAALLLFSIGCKAGLVLFNSHYNSLSEASFNRLGSVLILLQPFSAFVLLSKLNVMITDSSLSLTVPYWCAATFVFAGWEALILNNVNRKNIALAQMVFAAVIYCIYKDSAVFYTIAPKGLAILLFAACAIYICAVQSQQKLQKQPQFYCNFWVLLWLLPTIAVVGLLINDFILSTPMRIGAYVFIAVWGSICKTLVSSDNLKRVSWDVEPYKWWLVYPLIITASSLVMLYLNHEALSTILFPVVCFVAAFLLFPSNFFTSLGNKAIWNNGMMDKFYELVLVFPLKFFGRILWLAFDFVFVERGIIASISSLNETLVKRALLLQNSQVKSWFVWLLLGLIAVAIYVGVSVK